MAGLRKEAIASRLVYAIELSGATVSGRSFSGGKNKLPWNCSVMFPGGMERNFAMYFWTVSHGGRGRPEDEYRIQATLKGADGLKIGGATTLLLGYYEFDPGEEGSEAEEQDAVIVAWNALNHLNPGSSSSCQVKFGIIQKAARVGVDSHDRNLSDGVQEKVVAVRKDFFARYLVAAAGGHGTVTEDELRNSSYVRRQFRS